MVQSNPTRIAFVTLGGVILCWLIFASAFVFRKRPPKQTEARRDWRSLIGIGLQAVAFFLVWFQPPHRQFLPPVPALSGVAGVVYAAFTLGLAAGSVWLTAAAVRKLGKQWAYAARLVQGHELITDGPYAYVRNPIYTGLFGMLIAIGLALEHWTALLVAVVIFVVGLVIRIRSEEKLLREAFGQKFEEYAKRVSAVLPGIY